MRSLILLTAMTVAMPGSAALAQVSVQISPRVWAMAGGDPSRPVIGISTRSSGKRDTLGLLVESVTKGSPADSAGIEDGDRLASVNGISLRLTPADAGDPDLQGTANRRLVRELEKLGTGAQVELEVYRDGQTRTVRLKTVPARELTMPLSASFGRIAREAENRAVLGVSLGGTGSPRDTSGILVVGVVDDGPAAKAGVGEGDRIASINGVELRVAPEDAGDPAASQARMNRLVREMEKVEVGEEVDLTLWVNGRTKKVQVTAASASEVHQGSGLFFNDLSDVAGWLRGMELLPGGVLRLYRDGTVPGGRILPRTIITAEDGFTPEFPRKPQASTSGGLRRAR